MTKNYKYSPELLAQVAAESRSVNEVLRRLGLPVVGGRHTHISRRLKQLGIDTSHFGQVVRYTPERLARAAAQSTNMREMLANLDVKSYAKADRYVRKRCHDFGVDISHFTPVSSTRTWQSMDPERFRSAVAASQSIAGVIRTLGVAHTSYRQVHRFARKHGVDLSHLPGQAHNRGTRMPRLTAAEILRHEPERDRRVQAKMLRRALVEIGRRYECSECNMGDLWNGRPITLDVDHINGDWRDNRPQNLRFMCPNCHSQTDTFSGRNRGKASVPKPRQPERATLSPR
ncbi:MAG TPA: HNH endonuclease [Yinghuangia sp.]|uniref:hypothetical protein n=1 Tax=Yinghuangia sp. YIM S10712 TaxID=3436930 RepID=UPI002C4DAA22|nr:HNH endonuclease [Yinghuangia sp.]